jgi:hypothetical protein
MHLSFVLMNLPDVKKVNINCPVFSKRMDCWLVLVGPEDAKKVSNVLILTTSSQQHKNQLVRGMGDAIFRKLREGRDDASFLSSHSEEVHLKQ